RLVASNVWRTRRIVPARNMAAIRAITTSTSTLERRAISSKGSRTKPSILSSEIARIFALIGSSCSTGSISITKRIADDYPTPALDVQSSTSDVCHDMIKAIFFDAVGTLFCLTNRVGDHYALVASDVGLSLD